MPGVNHARAASNLPPILRSGALLRDVTHLAIAGSIELDAVAFVDRA